MFVWNAALAFRTTEAGLDLSLNLHRSLAPTEYLHGVQDVFCARRGREACEVYRMDERSYGHQKLTIGSSPIRLWPHGVSISHSSLTRTFLGSASHPSPRPTPAQPAGFASSSAWLSDKSPFELRGLSAVPARCLQTQANRLSIAREYST